MEQLTRGRYFVRFTHRCDTGYFICN